jgi:hypothetical protein
VFFLFQLIWYYPFFGMTLYLYIILSQQKYQLKNPIKLVEYFNQFNTWIVQIFKFNH